MDSRIIMLLIAVDCSPESFFVLCVSVCDFFVKSILVSVSHVRLRAQRTFGEDIV